MIIILDFLLENIDLDEVTRNQIGIHLIPINFYQLQGGNEMSHLMSLVEHTLPVN